MFSNDQQDALMKLAVMKGPALSIFVAMLIAQQPLLANELEIYTGYSNQAVTKGLKVLEVLKAAVSRGAKGWELLPNWRQLPLPILYIGNHDFHDSNHENHDSAPPQPHTRDLLTTFTTTTTKQIDQEAVVITREGNHENHDSVDNPVRDWLIRGGVGRNSPQMRKLLDRDFDLAYVQAHVLEKLAQTKAGNGRFTAGLLITKLNADDAAPPMRCEKCLNVECNCDNLCPNCGEPINPKIGWCYCTTITR